ncbi:SDR family NAD(P)-dependent oxidoreductase [Pectinatus sottacetonis]|uniref:SDR family NAD(P)-dependent oxidoreductase n=1 Tax=Pectinatus sottacetonis TaxID=1002795 RepID=UPI001E48BCC1|nr:SDR family NAD(P)-dependent oxidoreductase [Pectinatus sottacetonis]
MKIAVITGGTSGIGLAAAKLFLENGFTVVAIGKTIKKYETALKKLAAYKTRYHFIKADIMYCEECSRAAALIKEKFSQVEVLVNSAGIYQENPIDDVEEKDFDLMVGVNLKGTYFMCKYIMPLLRKNTTGASIVNISSDAGINGNYFCTLYCATKGAVTVFTKALALETAKDNIRVNCVCLGDINTPLTQKQLAEDDYGKEHIADPYPLGRIGTIYEAAEVIYFLASAKASFVTGAAWAVDGGLTAY